MPRTLFPVALSSSIFVAGLVTGSVVVLLPETATAQDDETLRDARAKFQKGLELEHAGDFGSALKLFRDVGQIKMTPQVRYHIATCEENLGQLVAALGGYELALAQSEEMHPDFIAEVQGSIDDLKARIPKLSIARADGSEAAQIQLDGVQLGENSIGGETPVDPGPHTITAKAPGFEDYQKTVTVSEGAVELVSVELVKLAKAPRGGSGAEARDAGPPDFGPWPYVAGGVGVGSLIIGGSLLGVSLGKFGKQKDLCGGDVKNCQASESEVNEVNKLGRQASGFEAGGWIGISVGLIGVGAGVAMLVMSRDPSEETPATTGVRLRPYAAGSDAGLSLAGSF
jgi:hypothetical protein